MFLMRFDQRLMPGATTTTSELYEAAVEMAAWGESRGCVAVVLSEHHGSSDGYLPAPLLLASAMVARTSTLPIQVAAVLVPFYDPVRLAEDMIILDILSRGRVSHVLGLGYRPEEYAMFGRPMQGRGRYMEHCVRVLQRALRGERFEFDGRVVHVTPAPFTPGGPPLFVGGSTPAAVRRAVRCGLGLYAQASDLDLESMYREECARVGVEPRPCIIPPPALVTSAFVAEDPEHAWEQIGPYLLHDARMYARWLGTAAAASKQIAASVADLRADPGPYRIFSVDAAIAYVRENGILLTQPLCGGIPPRLAWRSLELIVERVMPALG